MRLGGVRAGSQGRPRASPNPRLGDSTPLVLGRVLAPAGWPRWSEVSLRGLGFSSIHEPLRGGSGLWSGGLADGAAATDPGDPQDEAREERGGAQDLEHRFDQMIEEWHRRRRDVG